MHDHRELPLAVISPYIRNIINIIYVLGRMNLIYLTHYVLDLSPSDHSYRRATVARNPLGGRSRSQCYNTRIRHCEKCNSCICTCTWDTCNKTHKAGILSPCKTLQRVWICPYTARPQLHCTLYRRRPSHCGRSLRLYKMRKASRLWLRSVVVANGCERGSAAGGCRLCLSLTLLESRL